MMIDLNHYIWQVCQALYRTVKCGARGEGYPDQSSILCAIKENLYYVLLGRIRTTSWLKQAVPIFTNSSSCQQPTHRQLKSEQKC